MRKDDLHVPGVKVVKKPPEGNLAKAAAKAAKAKVEDEFPDDEPPDEPPEEEKEEQPQVGHVPRYEPPVPG